MTAYDYGNARLRAMKSRLLTRSQLEALADARGIPALVTALTATAYRPAVDAAVTRVVGPQVVFRALLIDRQETVARIARFYTGDASQALRIILLRFDIHNLKAVLRGLSRNAAPGSIAETWLPPGEVPEAALRELAQAGDLRAALDLMATLRMPAARPLTEARRANPGAGLFELELALSRWYYRTAKETLPETRGGAEILADDLAWQSDIEDLLTVLRFAGTPAGDRASTGEVSGILLGQGRLSARLLIKAAARESVEAAVGDLADTRYSDALGSGLRGYRTTGRLSDIEIELRRAHLDRSVGWIRTDPLGPGVPLGYLALKSNEIANLRWIARGVGTGQPAAEIKAGIR